MSCRKNVVHDLSSDRHLGVRLCDCSIPVTDISFKQLGKVLFYKWICKDY
ncbi:hypothetical protein T12_17068 [Trichinella patagoniensis]|uniref:Uncharacterized protein n=1 Tax=Trichinella patagoniensis TaxID=990121 RepID=A0A0V0YUH9_9BILA|nr:hypothetical protein T12_17068 [Trichinella patagoniensis]